MQTFLTLLINNNEIFDEIKLWTNEWNLCRLVYLKVPFATWISQLMLDCLLMPYITLLLILITEEFSRILRFVALTGLSLLPKLVCNSSNHGRCYRRYSRNYFSCIYILVTLCNMLHMYQEVLSRKVLVDEGVRQVVELEQSALWRFLWWSGTISVHVLVDQNRADRTVRMLNLVVINCFTSHQLEILFISSSKFGW